MNKLLLTLLLPLCLSSLFAQEMPIIGYRGVPKTYTSAERFREMNECGLNTCITMYDHEAQVLAVLKVAEVQYLTTSFDSATINAPDDVLASRLTSPVGSRYIVLVSKSLKNQMTVTRSVESRKVEPGTMLFISD